MKYWVTATTEQARAASFDAIELVSPATHSLLICEVYLWQTTDLGDAAEEVLRVHWARGFTTAGSGGQTALIAPLNDLYPTATFTALMNNATLATVTTPDVLAAQGWNVRIPFERFYPPGAEIRLEPSVRGVFRVSAPIDSITGNAACLVQVV